MRRYVSQQATLHVRGEGDDVETVVEDGRKDGAYIRPLQLTVPTPWSGHQDRLVLRVQLGKRRRDLQQLPSAALDQHEVGAVAPVVLDRERHDPDRLVEPVL